MDPSVIVLAILLVVPIIVIVSVIALYNGLVRVRNACDESWAGIDTELKRRYDLIPNLVNTVKGYAAHEKDVLERVIQARNAAVASQGSPEAQARDENALIGTLRQLFALAENYPDLKANQNFLQLQGELVNTEDRIQRSRRFYNANVRDLSNRIDLFPSSIIARMFHFTKREYFEVEDAIVRERPVVEF